MISNGKALIPMSQNANNFRFDITAWEGHHDFDMLTLCLKVAFAGHERATHWSQSAGVMDKVEHGRRSAMWKFPPRLVLYWAVAGKDITPFLAPLGYETAAGAVKAWLEQVDYANDPDHDGDNSKGWRVFNEQWGHVGGSNYAICAIEPAWLMHGK